MSIGPWPHAQRPVVVAEGATAGAPVTVEETASVVSTATMVDTVALRDTATHTSTAVSAAGYADRVLWVQSSLDQTVTVQIQASHDGTTWMDAGTAQSIAAGAITAITADQVAELSVRPFPFLRIAYTAATAPTTGTINIVLTQSR